MAALAPELLVQLDPGRFRADNLLEAEDWDAALYGCLDDRLDHAHLFPSLDPDPMFDCALAGGGSESPPDPPWHQESPGGCPDLQVKSEPNSPTSSHCSDSSCSSESQIWAPKSPEMGVKVESPPPLPCAPQDSAQSPQGVKSEFSPQNCRGNFLETPKSPLGAPKSPQSRRGNPKIHPKIAQSPQKTFVLQTLPGNPQGGIAVPTPAVLLPGGLLCLTPPGPPKATIVPRVTTLTTALTTTLSTGSTGSTGNAAGNSQVDVKALRRQQRMIKNRESASLSRRRRKEYVQSLEQKLRLALAENERLRRDNGALRRRLQELSGQPPPGPTPRTLACLGIFLLLTFHLRPLSLPQATPTEPPPAAPPPPRRHLLGIPEVTKTTPEIWGPRPEPLPHSFRNSTLTSPWVKTPKFLGTPDCRSFNRTESLRLADELRGWVRRHQKIHRGNPGEKHLSDQAFPSWKASGGTRIVPAVPPRAERAPPGQLQLYRSPDPPEPRILAAIDRRDDTFYVVSFRRDHLLLPARSHNKTSRPKMSLVMPAAALNDSLSGSGRGLQAMMQVDCEVMNTRVIHVRRRRAPPPSRPSPTRKPRSLVLGGASP